MRNGDAGRTAKSGEGGRRHRSSNPQPGTNDLFPVWGYDALESHRTDPKHFLAGNGFIRRGAGTLLVGHTGMGKTVLAEQVALEIAAGADLLGSIAVPRPCRVLYLESENDQDTVRRDVLSIVEARGLDVKLVRQNFQVRHVFGLADESFGAFVDEEAKRYRPDLVVVDHYQSYVAGNVNSAETWLKWIALVQGAMNVRRFALLLVVHKGKPKDVSEWDARQLVYEAMGSSAQANWARTSMELAPLKIDLRRFRLTFSKNADRTGLRNPDGSLVRGVFVEHSHDPDKPCWSICEDQTPETKLNLKAMVLAGRAKHPKVTQRELAGLLRVSKSVVAKYDTRKEKRR